MEHLLYIDYNDEIEQLLYYKRMGASRRVCLDSREGVVCHNQVCRLLFFRWGEVSFGIGKEK